MRALTSTLLSILSFGTAAGFAACSPYDPALGAKPFLCSMADPTCPEGYVCLDDGAGVMACTIDGPKSIDGGVSGFQCADDGVLEGPNRNDTVATASATPVAGQRPSITFAGLAICPDGDKDNYKIDITTSGQNLHAEVVFDSGSPLAMSVLNSSGSPIANGSIAGNKVTANVSNLPQGSSPYYVQVFGPATGKNNYKLTLKVTGP